MLMIVEECPTILRDIPQERYGKRNLDVHRESRFEKKVTLRGAQYEYYSVSERENGEILLSPRILTSPFEVSKKSLDTMDSSMENYQKGEVSKPLNL